MNRPELTTVPLAEVFPPRRKVVYATMNVDQWDALLAVMYDAGAVLIELDDQERPVRAYQRRK